LRAHNFKVESKDGTQYNLEELGLLVRQFKVHSPKPRHTREIIEDRDGFVDLGTTYEGRRISATISLFAADVKDYALLCNELFRIFDSRESFYIIADAEPGKRWLVKVEGEFSPDQTGAYGDFSIIFESPLAYAESINKIEYKHTENFSFNNIGDVMIDMRDQTETEIEFSGVSTDLIIRNKTTGEEWSYTGSTIETDVILLKGVRSTKNGVSVFGDTNKKILTFAPGWNDIEIVGSTSYTITLRTRFYYL
jgi:hypothetical protein